MTNSILVAIYIILAVCGSTFIKLGANPKAGSFMTLPFVQTSLSYTSLVGVVFYGLSFLLYLVLLSRFDLSFITPIVTGIIYILLMVSAVFVFGEQFTLIKTIGCILVLLGVTMIILTK